jgi:hypothetical protein
MNNAIDYSAPPCPFKPRVSKPAPSNKQHAAVVIAVQEQQVFALADQYKSVDKFCIFGEVKNVNKKSERSGHQLVGCQSFRGAKQACDTA